ncbi:high affinity immunoglobulin epsilon receptor subunit beta-like isoform X5 [Scyliorhinus canicula]|uniref:high affinity immunoglobulin epsilon receptor subunit beta-like isoform X5 n=1 Tax=Scyliorhinus canicula TaxID=7830 RepID=UPI0018F66579|nr:high affinity immunoglobulin epsilon receptor subunit beta-like isoform X5 [Scyliorhinus canicula]
MAASFNHRGMELTNFPSPAAAADYTNVAPMGQDSLQAQQVPGHRQKPLGREWKALGVVQIMLGIIQLTFGFVLYYNDSYSGSVGASWPGVSYIVSGVLSVLVKKGSKKALLVGNLVMNILSTVAAGVGIVIYSILLWTGPVCFARFCAPWHFLITTVIQLATAQNAPAQELQDENYETLLAGCSTYEALNFKGQSNFRPGESDYINPI